MARSARAHEYASGSRLLGSSPFGWPAHNDTTTQRESVLVGLRRPRCVARATRGAREARCARCARTAQARSSCASPDTKTTSRSPAERTFEAAIGSAKMFQLPPGICRPHVADEAVLVRVRTGGRTCASAARTRASHLPREVAVLGPAVRVARSPALLRGRNLDRLCGQDLGNGAVCALRERAARDHELSDSAEERCCVEAQRGGKGSEGAELEEHGAAKRVFAEQGATSSTAGESVQRWRLLARVSAGGRARVAREMQKRTRNTPTDARARYFLSRSMISAAALRHSGGRGLKGSGTNSVR